MSRKQSSLKTTVTHLYRTGQFTGRVVINYGFLLGVGVLLLYTVLGRDFIAGITWAATQIGDEFTKIGRYRFITAILALLLFIYGFSNNNWRQRHRIIATIGLFALIAIPAFFVLLGQIVLSTTELRLVADAFQSAGSLLLVILTVSYVAATRDMQPVPPVRTSYARALALSTGRFPIAALSNSTVSVTADPGTHQN